MALGARIRYYRNKAGLTLDQLSELSGVEMGTISALEVRDSTRSAYARKIASALGLTVDQLEDESADHDVGPVKAAPVRAAEPDPLSRIAGRWPRGRRTGHHPVPGHRRRDGAWLQSHRQSARAYPIVARDARMVEAQCSQPHRGEKPLHRDGVRPIDEADVQPRRPAPSGHRHSSHRPRGRLLLPSRGRGLHQDHPACAPVRRAGHHPAGHLEEPGLSPYDLSPKNPHFEVLGKVLTVWRSEQY
ncbi:helix-turn-helix domain-containing protein [Acidovorax citrulli]|nr:helix-turn-helix domain-containing protein [Paracidovorax citrulli]